MRFRFSDFVKLEDARNSKTLRLFKNYANNVINKLSRYNL